MIAADRRCRDCSAPLGTILEHQCVPCQERTEWRWVRPPKGVTQPPPTSAPVAAPKPVRVSPCSKPAHGGCRHWVALFKAVAAAGEDCAVCFLCGAADQEDGTHLEHTPDCPLAVLARGAGGE
jgi:hypothetical protein